MRLVLLSDPKAQILGDQSQILRYDSVIFNIPLIIDSLSFAFTYICLMVYHSTQMPVNKHLWAVACPRSTHCAGFFVESVFNCNVKVIRTYIDRLENTAMDRCFSLYQPKYVFKCEVPNFNVVCTLTILYSCQSQWDSWSELSYEV